MLVGQCAIWPCDRYGKIFLKGYDTWCSVQNRGLQPIFKILVNFFQKFHKYKPPGGGSFWGIWTLSNVFWDMYNGPWGIAMKKLGGQMSGCRWTKLVPSTLFFSRVYSTKHTQFGVKIGPSNIFGITRLRFQISAL